MSTTPETTQADDEKLLRQLGYKQELSRRMSGFSNFAISLSIICILAGGITSFQIGLCTAGGASIGLGWPLGCLFSFIVALTMGQIASAFPTAGGLYHWGSILGGRGCGWVTAWFNLTGLITVLAAVNAGAYDFAVAAFNLTPPATAAAIMRTAVVVLMTLSQGLLNHYGIRWTTRLTDLSGYLILFFSAALTVALLIATKHFEWARLWTFENYSGQPAGGAVVPKNDHIGWVFALGLLLPAYTITGFDASAHTSEETKDAARNVPRGIIRSVWISGLFGWVMICAILLALPSIPKGVQQGGDVVHLTIKALLPGRLAWSLLGGIVACQYLCGLAALTSCSRMIYAFARDGGLPFSHLLRTVNPSTKSPSVAVWASAIAAAAFTILVPYATIAAICVVLLYISYVLPVAAGFFAIGKTWTRMGPWHLGAWYRPLAALGAIGCVFLIVIGVQPPNQQAGWIIGGILILLLAIWFAFERKNFKGPPVINTRSSHD